jgi:hypothetical protein
MIKYRLVCNQGHEFEGWFKTGMDFDFQSAKGQVACPHCGSLAVSKAIMAPNVATRTDLSRAPEAAKATRTAEQIQALMRQLRATVEQHAEYVGPRFAEEARRVHFDESTPRGVYGEASAEEAKALFEEGIPILPLPRIREDLN